MQEAAAKTLAKKAKRQKTQASAEAPKGNEQGAEDKSCPNAKAKAKAKVPDAKKAADLEKAAEAASMLHDMYLDDCKLACGPLAGFQMVRVQASELCLQY